MPYPFMSRAWHCRAPEFCSDPMPRPRRETAALGPAIGAARYTGTAIEDVAERRKRGQDKAGGWGETIARSLCRIDRTVVPLCSIRTVNIPSGSMIQTLLVGELHLVSTYSYGYSNRFTSLFRWALSGRIFGQPARAG